MFHLDGIVPTARSVRTLLTSQMHPMTSRRNVTAPPVVPGQGSLPGTYRAEGLSTMCKSLLFPAVLLSSLPSLAYLSLSGDRRGISYGQLITEAAVRRRGKVVDSLIIAAVLVNVRILTNVLATVLVAISVSVNKSLGMH